MQDVLSLLEKRAEELLILTRADGGGLGLGAVFHRLIELVEGNRLPQIIRVFDAVDVEVEVDALEAELMYLLGSQIDGRFAAQDVIRQWDLLMACNAWVLRTFVYFPASREAFPAGKQNGSCKLTTRHP